MNIGKSAISSIFMRKSRNDAEENAIPKSLKESKNLFNFLIHKIVIGK